MKKISKNWQVILGVFIIVFLTTGCNSNKDLSITCTRTMNQNNITTSIKYNIEYSDDYVTRVKSVETVETDNSEILNTYKEEIESSYSPYQDIDYYEYNVDINDNKLTFTTDVNYEKVDTDKLLDIDSNNSELIKDGKIEVDSLKTVYENLGAICKND